VLDKPNAASLSSFNAFLREHAETMAKGNNPITPAMRAEDKERLKANAEAYMGKRDTSGQGLRF